VSDRRPTVLRLTLPFLAAYQVFDHTHTLTRTNIVSRSLPGQYGEVLPAVDLREHIGACFPNTNREGL
jgi:hypothetical protein